MQEKSPPELGGGGGDEGDHMTQWRGPVMSKASQGRSSRPQTTSPLCMRRPCTHPVANRKQHPPHPASHTHYWRGSENIIQRRCFSHYGLIPVSFNPLFPPQPKKRGVLQFKIIPQTKLIKFLKGASDVEGNENSLLQFIK